MAGRLSGSEDRTDDPVRAERVIFKRKLNGLCAIRLTLINLDRRLSCRLIQKCREEPDMTSYRQWSFPAGRRAALAILAALLLVTLESPGTAAKADQRAAAISTAASSSNVTDLSSARRRRHRHRGGDAAGLAFMRFAIGTMAAAIAAQQYRDHYHGYGHYYGPGYYYEPPGYHYGHGHSYRYARPYYAPRYYIYPY